MYEVEVKVQAEHAVVQKRLVELDAERTNQVHQMDTYYDAPHRDFTKTNEALRIRQETADDGVDEGFTQTKLTYKGPLVETESKTRMEHETTVGDATTMKNILNGLEFTPAAAVEKDREHYTLDGYTVTLDHVADLGEFVEVEQETEVENVESARNGALGVLRDLGLDPESQIRTSYLGLLLDDDDASE